MKKYNVTGLVSASVFVTVEAKDEQDAIDKASVMDEMSPMLCHYCARELDVGDVYEFIVEEDE